jgi:hypothetical protein
MKIYFSEATEDNSYFEDVVEGAFEVLDMNHNTHYFYCGVEHGECFDQVTIFDGCDRRVPISADDIPALIEALERCYSNYRRILRLHDLEETVESNMPFFVTLDAEPEIQPALY